MNIRTRRFNRVLAVGAWAVAVGVFAVQVWVLLDPGGDSLRTVFPDWPLDPVYDGYLRGIAWGDVLFSQPLFFLAGLGLWRMKRWGYIAGVGVGCIGLYFNVIQVGAQLYVGGEYSLYGAGVFGAPFGGTFLEGLMDWIGLIPFAFFPVGLGIYCAFQLTD